MEQRKSLCAVILLTSAILTCAQNQDPLEAIAAIVRQQIQERNNQEKVYSLGYKPISSSYYPVPTRVPQFVPVGDPWPDNAEDYDKFGHNNNNQQATSLEDKFNSQQHSQPGQRPILVVESPTAPLYSGPVYVPVDLWTQQNNNGQNINANVDNRNGDLATRRPETIPIKPSVKPSSFHPKPTFIPQLIPSGQPWPANAEGYQNFSQKPEGQRPGVVSLEDRVGDGSSQEPVQTIQQSRPPQTIQQSRPPQTIQGSRPPQTIQQGSRPESIPAKPPVPKPSFQPSNMGLEQTHGPGTPWPAKPEDYQGFGQGLPTRKPSISLINRVQDTQQVSQETIPIKPPVKPSSFHPFPTEIPQLIPPGKPWPANQEDYDGFSQVPIKKPPITLEDRVQDTKPVQTQPSDTIPIKPPVKPSSFFPFPTEIPQLIPPGKPWPANQEDYNNFSQIPSRKPPVVALEDRVGEDTGSNSKPSGSSDTIPIKPPVRPSSFFPRPTEIPQLIPPGQPWPQNEDGYKNFTQAAVPLGNRFNTANNGNRNKPTRRPISTSTFPSLVHNSEDDGKMKDMENVPVSRAQQILFPDDEMFKQIELFDKQRELNNNNVATQKPITTSTHPNLLHSQGAIEQTTKQTAKPAQVLDTSVLHTSPHNVTPPPPVGSLFTSAPKTGHHTTKKEQAVDNSAKIAAAQPNTDTHIRKNNQHVRNPNIAVANLLPDSVRVTDVGFTNENLVGRPIKNGVYPPDNILTSATIIAYMQSGSVQNKKPENLQHTSY